MARKKGSKSINKRSAEKSTEKKLNDAKIKTLKAKRFWNIFEIGERVIIQKKLDKKHKTIQASGTIVQKNSHFMSLNVKGKNNRDVSVTVLYQEIVMGTVKIKSYIYSTTLRRCV